jgi:IclR family KDG regulon transcriptional repressor
MELALQILESLARSEMPRRITDLADELGTSKPRIFRHLRTMVNLGYVLQDEDTERYQIGIRLALLGDAAAGRFDLREVSRPALRELRDILGFTAVMSKVEGGKVYIVEKFDAVSPFSITIATGTSLALHATAQGKLVLAFGRKSIAAAHLGNPLASFTPATITDPKRLRAELEQIRRQGWAVAPGETLAGMNVLAMPVFNDKADLVATVGLLGPEERLGAVPKPRELSKLKAAVQVITRRLKGAPVPALKIAR